MTTLRTTNTRAKRREARRHWTRKHHSGITTYGRAETVGGPRPAIGRTMIYVYQPPKFRARPRDRFQDTAFMPQGRRGNPVRLGT